MKLKIPPDAVITGPSAESQVWGTPEEQRLSGNWTGFAAWLPSHEAAADLFGPKGLDRTGPAIRFTDPPKRTRWQRARYWLGRKVVAFGCFIAGEAI